MRRFRFALEGLLRIRRLAEEQTLATLHGLEREVIAVLEDLRSVALDRNGQVERLGELEAGDLPIAEILSRRRYLNVLDRRTHEGRERLTRLANDIKGAKQALAKAVTDRKVVERLRERRYEEYLSQARREETAFFDEASQARHVVGGEL